MTYAAQADLVERYGSDELIQLTDRATPSSGAIDAGVVTAALTDADAEINSYIRTKVATPVVPVPGILVQMACAIARYRIWKDRASEKVTQDYKDAIAWCKGVARGDIALGDATSSIDAPSAGAPQVSQGCSRFNDDTLRDF